MGKGKKCGCIFKKICGMNFLTKGLCKLLCLSCNLVKKVLCLTKFVVCRTVSLPITFVQVASRDLQHYVPALKPLFGAIGGLICWTTNTARHLVNFALDNPTMFVTVIVITDVVYILYENNQKKAEFAESEDGSNEEVKEVEE